MTIIIFGDSITNRAQDEEGGGWTSRLWKRAFDTHQTSYGEGIVFADHSVMELGIGGDTIVGVSRRFESELETRINIINSGGDPSTFIVGLAVGLNDSRFNEDTRIHKVEFEEFSRLYENLIDRMLRRDITIFTVGLTPVQESKTRQTSYTVESDSYANESVEKYNSEIQRLSQSKGIKFVDINSAFKKVIDEDGPESLLSDGLHPNARGHQIIADEVFQAIDGWL